MSETPGVPTMRDTPGETVAMDSETNRVAPSRAAKVLKSAISPTGSVSASVTKMGDAKADLTGRSQGAADT